MLLPTARWAAWVSGPIVTDDDRLEILPVRQRHAIQRLLPRDAGPLAPVVERSRPQRRVEQNSRLEYRNGIKPCSTDGRASDLGRAREAERDRGKHRGAQGRDAPDRGPVASEFVPILPDLQRFDGDFEGNRRARGEGATANQARWVYSCLARTLCAAVPLSHHIGAPQGLWCIRCSRMG
jgi:hypothetical protein